MTVENSNLAAVIFPENLPSIEEIEAKYPERQLASTSQQSSIIYHFFLRLVLAKVNSLHSFVKKYSPARSPCAVLPMELINYSNL